LDEVVTEALAIADEVVTGAKGESSREPMSWQSGELTNL
jgi:hypothetical protein